MDGDWTLKEYRPGRYVKILADGTILGRATEAEVRAWLKSRESDWTLVEYRPGRYARATESGTVLGKATETQLRTWFTSQRGKGQPDPATKSPDQTMPASAEKSAESEIHAWFAARRQERQAAASEPTRTHAGEADGSQSTLVPAQAETLGGSESADAPTLVADRPQPEETPVQAEKAPPELDAAGPTLPTGGEADIAQHEPIPAESIPPPDPLDHDLAEVALEPGFANGPEPKSTAMTSRESDTLQDEPPTPDAGDRWLWVDPRQEPGYDPATFDLAAFLSRAAKRLQSKQWAGGREPARIAVHPDQVANGLKPVADTLGLQVVTDPTVPTGTYRLGLAPNPGAQERTDTAQ